MNTEPIVLDPTVAAFTEDQHVNDLGTTHFIGIGGAGMSVLAEMLHEQGVHVTGSDREHNAKTERLETLGIPVAIGQRADNVRDASTVVYSSAIKLDNPEIIAAAEHGAHIVHRSDILALLMNHHDAVAVAGAHGKTTTSSLLSHILVHAGTDDLADPSYAIGGTIQGPDGQTLDGGHAGAGRVLVAEADESDGSFAKYRPAIAIITNAEADHLDHYGTPDHYCEAFVAYASHARDHIVMTADDPGALDVLRGLDDAVMHRTVIYTTQSRQLITDAVAQAADATIVTITSESEHAGNGEEQFTIDMPATLTGDEHAIPVSLKIPGIHNARNATAAIITATLLGMDPDTAAQAAGSFLGASRRFQVRGQEKQVTVVDDYAHHPTEITALLNAARRRYPDATIRVLFQPHLFSRTKFFAREFAQALALADDVIVTGIYPAREKQEDFPDITAQTIVDAAQGIEHEPADWIRAVDDMHTAALMMAMRAHHGDVVFTVGAGDITAMGPVLLHALEAHRENCEG